MRRIIVFALVLNAVLLGEQGVALAGGDPGGIEDDVKLTGG